MASLLCDTQKIPLTICDVSHTPVSRVIIIPPGGVSRRFLGTFRPRSGASPVACRWPFTARGGLRADVVG